jgi:hypothetical protein
MLTAHGWVNFKNRVALKREAIPSHEDRKTLVKVRILSTLRLLVNIHPVCSSGFGARFTLGAILQPKKRELRCRHWPIDFPLSWFERAVELSRNLFRAGLAGVCLHRRIAPSRQSRRRRQPQ